MMQASQANWRPAGQRSIDALADEGRTILRMITVQYETRRNGEHIFWVSRHCAHSIRIDANRPASTGGGSAATVGPLPAASRWPLPFHAIKWSTADLQHPEVLAFATQAARVDDAREVMRSTTAMQPRPDNRESP